MTKRIGIFGGTFDPIHLGHLLLAETARRLLALTRVLFIPARVPPHKSVVATSPEQRYRMVDLACDDNPHFEVSDLEIRREGPSYTVETLRALMRAATPDTKHFLLIGADSASDLESWKDYDALLDESAVVVLGRPGHEATNLAPAALGRLTFLDTPLVQISSSEIRRLAGRGDSIRYLVTDPVERYIRSEGLYLI